MKRILFITVLFISLLAVGQQTIEVTKNSTITLIFPEQVVSRTIGNPYEYILYENNSNDVISNKMVRVGYNINGNGQSKTNLSIVTADGLLYEFILSYSKELPKLTHQILKSQAAMNLNPPGTPSVSDGGVKTAPERIEVITTPESSYTEGTETKVFNKENIAKIDPATIVTNELYQENKEAYIYLQCKNTQFREKRIFRTFDKAYNVVLRLKSVNYDNDELYIYLTLDNDAAQAYEVDFVKFAITTVKKGARTDQEPPHIPPYLYNPPKRVEGHSEHHFVVVFNKFPLSKDKELQIEIREKNGDRNLILKLDHLIINNPQEF